MDAPPVIAMPRANNSRIVWPWLLVALLVTVIGVALYIFNPSQYGFYPRCALYVTTGLYCPGCGSLRAMHQLSHGHLLAALHDNLLLVASLPFVAIYGWRHVGCLMNGKNDLQLPNVRVVMIFAAVTIVFTMLRNIHCAPFDWLAPLP